MKLIELNREGIFERWNPDHLNELNTLNQAREDRDCVLHEDPDIRLSIFGLEPYERIPFRVLQHNFSMVFLTGGTAISRSYRGSIDLLLFEQGETVIQPIKSSAMINDLQNIGEEQMIVAIIEYLSPITYKEWVDGIGITTRSPRSK